ncbi:MAG: hypothetical protein FWE21_09185 [Defluviitaleaceae bacterium]|nr:hypothetical protein [Defluviitaleaceae bacterium]
MKAKYRRGGIFMLPSTAVAIAIAAVLSAPIAALISVATFGFGGGVALILFGDRRE